MDYQVSKFAYDRISSMRLFLVLDSFVWIIQVFDVRDKGGLDYQANEWNYKSFTNPIIYTSEYEEHANGIRDRNQYDVVYFHKKVKHLALYALIEERCLSLHHFFEVSFWVDRRNHCLIIFRSIIHSLTCQRFIHIP